MVAGIVFLAVLRALTGRRPTALSWLPVIIVIGLTGFSRLGLGVHYLSDVVGGYLLGAAWALTMVAALVPPSARVERAARVDQAGSTGQAGSTEQAGGTGHDDRAEHTDQR
jgi:undecaprenyl-diphosphatase